MRAICRSRTFGEAARSELVLKIGAGENQGAGNHTAE